MMIVSVFFKIFTVDFWPLGKSSSSGVTVSTSVSWTLTLVASVGSMNAANIRLKRKTVKKEVQNHYDHDKDFFLSFLKSYIVEALCDFFGIEEITDRPTVNVPDDPNDYILNPVEAQHGHNV
jgi:hypothetical protein